MPIPLPPDLPYSYSLAPGETVTATVTGANPVDYGYAGDGLVDRAVSQAIPPGGTRELDTPGWLSSPLGSEVDLAYPQPPEAPPPEPLPE